MRATSLLCMAGVVVAGSAHAGLAVRVPSSLWQDKKVEGRTKLSDRDKAKAAKAIDVKSREMAELRDRANSVTSKIADVAKAGKVTSDESVKALQDMVQELQKINDQLKKMQDEIDEIKGWIEGQNESMPVLVGDVENLKRATWGNYVQFQYSDTEEGPNSNGGKNRVNNDGFAMRRLRLSTTNRIDPRTSAKLSFDVAAGSQRQTAELKDAQLQWDLVPSDTVVGTSIFAGQQPIPLGYELERSSSEREMPERSLYNRTMFNGERGRGVYVKHGLGKASFAHLGVWNSLTVNDAQQNDVNRYGNLTGTSFAMHGGIRFTGTQYDFGVTGFFGTRDATAAKVITAWTDSNLNGVIDNGEVKNTNVPATASNDRRFIYLDGTYVGLIVPQLTVRGEFMFGKDRVPTLSSSVPTSLAATNMNGYQIQATYNINYRNALTLRWEAFDPDTDTGGNTASTLGLAYGYYINPLAKLTIAHEWNREQPFNAKNNAWTLRIQYRL